MRLMHVLTHGVLFEFLDLDRGSKHDAREVFPIDERGVTTRSSYPYRDPESKKPQKPYEFKEDWKRYKLEDYEYCNDDLYKGKDKGCINHLIRRLRKGGPFLGWYYVRDSHDDARKVLKKKGRIALKKLSNGQKKKLSHSITISGYKKWKKKRKGINEIRGFWEFRDSYGKEGRSGFGRIEFNALSEVLIPIPDFNTY